MKIKNINLKRAILENLLEEDLDYMEDFEIEEMFDETKEDNFYYINELKASLKIREQNQKENHGK